VGALAPEHDLPVHLVEARADLHELVHAVRALAHQYPDRLLIAEPGPRLERVLEMEIRRVALAEAARLGSRVQLYEDEFVIDLLTMDGRCVGALTLNLTDGELTLNVAMVTVLATGGAGQVYGRTTNPAVATGDGVAMAYRAGAAISDMEFVQFHPTALYLKKAPRFLLSEALRGEGAVLRNAELDRFMSKYHESGELAPRDVVARAIAHELEVSPMKDPVVYLDMTHLKEDHTKARFPRIYSTCLEYNIDITVDLVPIRPAAHYLMGGVRTDLHGRSSLPGLYAAGETACTGVHGANRLASNSLLEGLVYGARAGQAMREQPSEVRPRAGVLTVQPEPGKATTDTEEFIREIQQLMWTNAGIVRTRQGLTAAVHHLQASAECLPLPFSRRNCEARNLHTCGQLIARSALARLESRGAHYRTDYPVHDDARFHKHSIVTEKGVRFE